MFALKQETLTVRGEKLIVREMTAGAREAIVAESKNGGARSQMATVLHCALTADGKPMFGSLDEVAALPTEVVDEIATRVMELSGGKSVSPKG